MSLALAPERMETWPLARLQPYATGTGTEARERQAPEAQNGMKESRTNSPLSGIHNTPGSVLRVSVEHSCFWYLHWAPVTAIIE